MCSHVIDVRTRWDEAVDSLSRNGYRGLCMEYPSHARSIDEACDIVHNNIRDYELSPPPVLIAHSMSSFLAQKYLESYAASGLILVNPLPINCSRSLAILHDRWSNCITDVLREKLIGNCNDYITL